MTPIYVSSRVTVVLAPYIYMFFNIQKTSVLVVVFQEFVPSVSTINVLNFFSTKFICDLAYGLAQFSYKMNVSVCVYVGSSSALQQKIFIPLSFSDTMQFLYIYFFKMKPLRLLETKRFVSLENPNPVHHCSTYCDFFPSFF